MSLTSILSVVQISQKSVDDGAEYDIGAIHATKDDYGRLTVRKAIVGYEIYDLNNDKQVDSDSNLRKLIGRAGRYTTMSVGYTD